MPHIFQINVSHGGKPKLPIHDDYVTINGLASDKRNNIDKHNVPERALSLFSLEKIIEIQESGFAVFPGAMGENLTLVGINWATINIGDKFLIGKNVEIEITVISGPCKNISQFYTKNTNHNINENTFQSWSRYFAKVLHEGIINIGDRVTNISV